MFTSSSEGIKYCCKFHLSIYHLVFQSQYGETCLHNSLYISEVLSAPASPSLNWFVKHDCDKFRAKAMGDPKRNHRARSLPVL